MIVRQFGVRQSRQLLALSRRAPVSARFLSTETAVETPVTSSPESSVPSINSPLESGSTQSKQSLTESEQRWRKWEASKNAFHKLGSTTKDSYEPVPLSASEITLEHLLAAGTHMGHSTSRWNPQNSRYIFGIREGVHIISLDVTAAYLRRAAKVVEEVAARGGIILFAGTRKGQKRSVVGAAHLAKGYHIFERWIPGSLTNGEQILGHCETKVVNAFDEELPEFKNDLQDRPVVKPDLVVVLNPLENVVLLHECGLNNVPTIGIIDTDADPTRVTYPIPANDDSLRSTDLIAGVLGRAGQAGQNRRLQDAKDGKFSYQPVSADWLRLDPFTGMPLEAEQQKKK
ncbi:Ribosomal protein S2 bacteria/mitochondria/plastid [Penicillium chermesinum]|uniref:Ribosomal protein S2 bacteria/mitochondria/plastid n=1 Tax=Penicillium chermesinum TaxID=63820 RepID=A0A9W9TB32_9EURO|nr:Ribosomal protein S2 bacteria/mitochondria/plastid [Penicillium chermesinum]KAJ5215105.1 Ribosomal protein S2 bacteria/mitochondria/plastid [Penicillium chermesinum]KAJ6141405.1 Ribosomal protein S2 bacteria/mitochondria/plastid [Penicillium chermesinum]